MRPNGAVAKTLIAVGVLLALALMVFFAMEKDESVAAAPRLNPDSVESFWGYSIDGRQVPCFTMIANSGVAITCDWDTALIPPLEDTAKK